MLARWRGTWTERCAGSPNCSGHPGLDPSHEEAILELSSPRRHHVEKKQGTKLTARTEAPNIWLRASRPGLPAMRPAAAKAPVMTEREQTILTLP